MIKYSVHSSIFLNYLLAFFFEKYDLNLEILFNNLIFNLIFFINSNNRYFAYLIFRWRENLFAKSYSTDFTQEYCVTLNIDDTMCNALRFALHRTLFIFRVTRKNF